LNQIPESILNDSSLNAAISQLPPNYNFEIHKTVWRIKSEGARVVALQFPEGLLMFSCLIADIVRTFAGAEVIILGDVTYGACCVDDFTPSKLGAEFLVHYGHSCLVPMNELTIKVLYVFVEIHFDVSHLIQVLQKQFSPDSRIALMGTIQFNSAVHDVLSQLKGSLPHTFIGQAKPLSQGETLGCTAPVLAACDSLVFVADGRFHLEAAMIQNPTVPAYRYDPYSKILTSEGYDVAKMKSIRWNSIQKARGAKVFGVILGTLGRQGNVNIFLRIQKMLQIANCETIPFLMAEINPAKLAKISLVEVWVQVACPRLSIDWGEGFDRPILTPYELEVMLGGKEWEDVYPMDYYSSAGGPWANMHHRKVLQAPRQRGQVQIPEAIQNL
jgi:2-(3-amino-3-carboxypropyl)histidine synthase